MSVSKSVRVEVTLLPCPWPCGSTPVVREYEWKTAVAPMTWYAGCLTCRLWKEGMSRAEAIAAWNTRPTSARDAALREEGRVQGRAEALDEVLSVAAKLREKTAISHRGFDSYNAVIAAVETMKAIGATKETVR